MKKELEKKSDFKLEVQRCNYPFYEMLMKHY